MELFSNDTIKAYEPYFDLPKVIEYADNIVDTVKKGNELKNDNERLASVILAYQKLKQYYSNK